MSDRKDFRQQTEDGLVACGKWLEKNAEDLSKTLGDGSRSWSIEFAWETITDHQSSSGIHIMVNEVEEEVIDAFR